MLFINVNQMSLPCLKSSNCFSLFKIKCQFLTFDHKALQELVLFPLSNFTCYHLTSEHSAPSMPFSFLFFHYPTDRFTVLLCGNFCLQPPPQPGAWRSKWKGPVCLITQWAEVIEHEKVRVLSVMIKDPCLTGVSIIWWDFIGVESTLDAGVEKCG